MKKLLSLLLCLTFTNAAAAPQPLDRLIAIVNEKAVTQSELEQEMESARFQLRSQGRTLPGNSILREQVLELMIMKRIQQQLARQSNIIIDDETLNRAISTIAEQNNLSLSQFREVLLRDGYNFTQFREDIRHQILTNRLRQRYVDNRISITEAEVSALLDEQKREGGSNDEYHIGHILVSTSEGADTDEIGRAKAKAQQLLEQIKQGSDFAEIAVSHSDGQKALSGGDLGWFSAAQLPTLFANTVSGMESGRVSELIRSPSGFHIIKLIDHRSNIERHIITQTHARHILIKTDALTSDLEAENKLHQLKERVEQGDDFGELAKAHSADKANAGQGGDLGWFGPGAMVPRFESAIDELEPGQTSEPFQTSFGWHLAQVLERRRHDATDEQLRNNARRELLQRKVSEEEALWLRRLRDEAYVEIRH